MSDDQKREHLVAIGRKMIKTAKLPEGFNAVVVVTDAMGEWCAVSSSDDAYTQKLLTAALNGADLRLHERKTVDVRP